MAKAVKFDGPSQNLRNQSPQKEGRRTRSAGVRNHTQLTPRRRNRKRKQTLVEPEPPMPPKKPRRTDDGDAQVPSTSAEQDSGAGEKDDPESAPGNSAFYDGINQRARAGRSPAMGALTVQKQRTGRAKVTPSENQKEDHGDESSGDESSGVESAVGERSGDERSGEESSGDESSGSDKGVDDGAESLLRLPHSSKEPTVVEAGSGGLVTLFNICGKGKYLLPRESETRKEWWHRMKQDLGAERERLYKKILRLLQHLEDLPRAPAFEEQVKYLRTHQADIERNLRGIQKRIDQIESLSISPGTPNKNNGWHQGLVPILVHCLKGAFLAGTNDNDFRRRGKFTAGTLALFFLLCRWIEQVMGRRGTEPAVGPSQPGAIGAAMALADSTFEEQMRISFLRSLGMLKIALTSAEEQLVYLANVVPRREQAIINDKCLRDARERRLQMERERQRRQIQLYYRSRERNG
ncbi:hypothetical protein CDD83_6027 [Cordyceps sp. RAO-2017]|nr:hypothetical protein CDD83_6027 [Cordyceps sp. RAO-2017]